MARKSFLTLASCVGLIGAAQAQFDELQNYGDGRTDGGGPGTFTDNGGGSYTITAGGGDFWGNADRGSFLTASDGSLTTTTDFTATARHVRTTDPSTNNWGREPLMMRAQPATGGAGDAALPDNPSNQFAGSANYALHRTSSGNGLGNPGLVTGWRDNPGQGYGDNRNTVPGVGALDEIGVFMSLARDGADLWTGFAGDLSFGAPGGIPGRWIGTNTRTHPNIGVGTEVTVGVGHQSHNAIPGGAGAANTATWDSFNLSDGAFNPALFGPAPAADYGVFGTLGSVDPVTGAVLGTAGTFENGAATGEPTGWKITANAYEIQRGANADGKTIIPNVDWTGNNGTSATNPAPYNQGQPGDFTLAVPGFSTTNQDNYGVHMTGEIFIPAAADRLAGDTISFKDGVDDYTFLSIDGAVLIDDNSWTGYVGSQNGGSPIVGLDVSDGKYDDGEWVSFEMITWEGGGGDAGVLYWDQNGAGFPAASDVAATTDAIVPTANFRRSDGPGLFADIYLGGNPGNLGAILPIIAPGPALVDTYTVTGTDPVGGPLPNPVLLTGDVDVFKLNGATGADPGGGDGAAPSRFFGTDGTDGIRGQIQAAIDSVDPGLTAGTHPDTLIGEGETPNPGQNDNYRLCVRGEFVVDNNNGVAGETLDLTFTLRTDDGSQLRIIGQDFTATAGDGRTFLEDIDGDASLTADFFTGNTNALGHISLPEGTYQFESYMYEGGGGSRYELQAATGLLTAFDGSFFVIDGIDPGGDIAEFPGVRIPGGAWDEVVLMVTNTGSSASASLGAISLPTMEVFEGAKPVYWQDFDGFADGTTDLGDGSQMNGTANTQGGQLELTRDGVAGGFASFNIPAMPGSSNGWSASFDLTLIDSPGANPPADGMSFNYGNFGLGELGSAEEGMAGAGGVTENLSFEVDTWMNLDGEQGVNIAEKAAGADLNLAFTNGPILLDGTTVSGHVTMSWDPSNGASFSTTGLNTNAAFSNVATTFAAADDLLFGLSGRVGGANETKLIDNLHIETELPLTPVIDDETTIDYGKTSVPIARDFTVVNLSNGPLNITGVTLPGGFSLIAPAPAPIPAGGSLSAQIQFDAVGASGEYGGTVSIETDAYDTPFTFDVIACLDNEPPQFTSFPTKTVVVAASGELSAVATWEEPTIEDNFDPAPTLTQTAGDPSGSSFPIGVTGITYEAADAYGNTIEMSFDVVVSLNADDVLAIATSDEDAPGADAGFNGFNGGYIAGPGHVLLQGTARDTSELGAAGAVGGAWSGNVNDGSLDLIALQGTTAPPDGSGTVDGILRTFIAKNGNVAYRARTAGGGEGHWCVEGGSQSAVAVLGGAALGSTIDRFASAGQALNSAGEYYLLARVAQEAGVTKFNDWGIWSNTSGLLIRKGDPVAAVAGATYLNFEPQIAGNNNGQLVFSAAMQGGSIANGVDNRALFAGPWNNPAIVAQKGGAEAGGSGATYNQFSCEAINKDNAVAFSAVLSGAGLTAANNTSLYTNIGGSVSQIVREGDPALGFEDGEVYDSFGDVFICANDSVWVKVRVRGDGVSANSDDAVYVWRPGGLELVAREGDVAPGTAGVIRSLSKLTATECCHAAFTASLQRNVGGVTRRNSDGLWFVPAGSSAAQLLVRGGDTFTLGEDEQTVQRPDILETADDGMGGRSSALGAGNVVVSFSYAGGAKSGVFLIGLPSETPQ